MSKPPPSVPDGLRVAVALTCQVAEGDFRAVHDSLRLAAKMCVAYHLDSPLAQQQFVSCPAPTCWSPAPYRSCRLCMGRKIGVPLTLAWLWQIMEGVSPCSAVRSAYFSVIYQAQCVDDHA